MKDITVLRQPIHVAEGTRTSLDRAWKYEQFHSALKTLGLATGFKEPISVYVIRRETGNVMNVIAVKLQFIYVGCKKDASLSWQTRTVI